MYLSASAVAGKPDRGAIISVRPFTFLSAAMVVDGLWEYQYQWWPVTGDFNNGILSGLINKSCNQQGTQSYGPS